MNDTRKKKIFEELKLFWILTIYLACFLCALTLYRRLILEQPLITYLHYGYNLVEAAILAKIILIGRMMGLGRRFLDKSLIIPILYETFVMCLFVVFFNLIEHFITGYFHGDEFKQIYQRVIDKGIYQALGTLPILFLVFLLFFAFLEIARVMGENRLYLLLFNRKAFEEEKKS